MIPGSGPALTHRPPVLDALEMSIGLEILNLRDAEPHERIAYARSYTADMQLAADVLVTDYGRGKRTPAAQRELVRTFAAYTRVIAVLAYQPGGVTVMGRHWCTDHAACRAAQATAALDLAAAG